MNKIHLRELYFSNIMAYGEDNVINFDKYNDCKVGILTTNKIGKTTLIKIILYSLFGEYDKSLLIKDGITSNIIFEAQGNIYCINRFCNKLQPTVVLYSIENDVYNDISCTTNKKTNQFISSIIGEYKEYLVTCVSLNQKLINKILDGDNFLSEFLGQIGHDTKTPMSEIISKFEDIINYVYQSFGFYDTSKLLVKVIDDNAQIFIKETENDRKRHVSTLSSTEIYVLNLAVRTAFCSMTSRPCLDILFLDSSRNIFTDKNQISNIFRNVKEKFNSIYVVDTIYDGFRESLDKTIYIEDNKRCCHVTA